jgi:nucleotide-binding universal stress UspA family protein
MSLHDRILLATDLSARSDRALDRAMLLAARDGAELVVLHVLEPVAGSRYYPRTQPLPSLAGLVREQLVHDLGECAAEAQIRVEEGDPAEVIERVARELNATVVIVGVARVEWLGRFVLGATVERLVRAVEAPLLIVTARPRRPYERIVVGVDLSPVSAQTIRMMTSLYPEQRITAFHAFQPLTYGSSNRELATAQSAEVAATKLDAWLATTLSAEARARVVPRIEHGDPARLLREAAAHGAFDLVVLGTRGRGRIFEFFIGSVAKQILAELPCDALFVREAR